MRHLAARLAATRPSGLPPVYLGAAEQAEWCRLHATTDEQRHLLDAFQWHGRSAGTDDFLASVIKYAALQRGQRIAEAYAARFDDKPPTKKRGAPPNPPLMQDVIFAFVAISCEVRMRSGAKLSLNKAFEDVATYLGPQLDPSVVRRAHNAAAQRMSGWLAAAREEPPEGEEPAPELHYRRAAFGFSFQRVFELAFDFLDSEEGRAKSGSFAGFAAKAREGRCNIQTPAEGGR
jgi:hypothetical protein